MFVDVPNRIEPYVPTLKLNEPVEVFSGVFKILRKGDEIGNFTGAVVFRWFPTAKFEILGDYLGSALELGDSDLALIVEEANLTIPIVLTRINGFNGSLPITGQFCRPARIATNSYFDTLLFSLVNFPHYIAAWIKSDSATSSGRLEVSSPRYRVVVDEIEETKELRDTARTEGGVFISHVCELSVRDGPIDLNSIDELLKMLHLFFGFVRGAWAGPVFPRGHLQNEQVWAEFDNWVIDEPTAVTTWLPQRPDLNDMFKGFVARWENEDWRDPLTTAIAWYVEANSSRLANEARIVLAQCALELLANFTLVETERLFAKTDYEKLSAAGRIRALCHYLKIPPDIPSHLSDLKVLRDSETIDGAGVVVRVRNALVHAAERKRKFIQLVSGSQRFQAAQLSLQYVELTLLALFGYRGKYARRGWQGWRGDEEAPVPWVDTV